MNKMRKEEEIFQDLKELCSSEGYSHVISFICFNDNYLSLKKGHENELFEQMYSAGRLNKNEISTIIGLMIQNQIEPDGIL